MMKPVYEFKNIQIELTNACVHSCSNCTRFCGHHVKPFFMDWDTFQKSVDSLENWPRMVGMMGGEPTLHPEFKRYVEYALEKRPPSYEVGGGEKPRRSLSKYIMDANQIKSGPLNKFRGLGLWSSVCDTYYKHYELIQDSFIFQCVNDHTAVSRHQPWLLTRKELGVPDDLWVELRDNCWWQRYLNSPSITPKGAFFCEVAAAMDILFDGPGGWKIEKDWWQRGPEDFKDQLHWCELCSGALLDFDRDANENKDDVSPIMYEKLKAVNSPKLNQGNVILHTLGEEDEIKLSPRKTMLLYQDDDELRVTNLNKALYPRKVEGFVTAWGLKSLSSQVIDYCRNTFHTVTVFAEAAVDCPFPVVELPESEFFIALGKIIRHSTGWMGVISGDSKKFLPDFQENEVIYNPGTFHYFPEEQLYLFHGESSALKKAGFDTIKSVTSWGEFQSIWTKQFVAFPDYEKEECPDYEDWVKTITLKGVVEFNYIDGHLSAIALRRHIQPKIKDILEKKNFADCFEALDEISMEKLPFNLLCNEIKKAILHLVCKMDEKTLFETVAKTKSFTGQYALAMVTSGETQEKHLIHCVIHPKNLCYLGLDYLMSFQPSREGIVSQCRAVVDKDVIILGNRYQSKSIALILHDLGKQALFFADDEKEHLRFDGVRTLSVKNAVEKYPDSILIQSGYGSFGSKLKSQCDFYGRTEGFTILDEAALVELDATKEDMGISPERLQEIKEIKGAPYLAWKNMLF